MMRVSKIREPTDFEIEQRREALRDRRARRHCRVILSIGFALALAGAGLHTPPLGWLYPL